MRTSLTIILVALCSDQAWAFSLPCQGPDPGRQVAPPITRRSLIETIVAGTMILPSVSSAEEVPSPFEMIRKEVFDSSGGVAYMQLCIDKEDYGSLMEFTKTYDQVLRKGAMGKAKKTLDKSKTDAATKYANGVTFDLIGINRSSRPGQENKDNANKYLQELRDDVNKFLELEKAT